MFVNFDVKAEDARLWWVSKLEPEWSYRYITTGLAVRVRWKKKLNVRGKYAGEMWNMKEIKQIDHGFNTTHSNCNII